MTFEEVLDELGKETEEIEVCACGAYRTIGGTDIGIRTGSAPAGVKFHDPIIDGYVFMICGDIFTMDGVRVSDIKIFENYGPEEPLKVFLRAVDQGYYGNGIEIEVQLGLYSIEKYEIVKWGDFATDCCVKLTLKRRGS